jgi:tetratricopeptide (TPR) repeat protein
MTQVGMKEYTAAVDNLERAFKLAPSGPPVGAQRVILGAAYFKLAEANAMLGKKGAALKALKEAAKLLPSDQYPAFEAEPNLASLRTERDYQQLLASLKKVKKGK